MNGVKFDGFSTASVLCAAGAFAAGGVAGWLVSRHYTSKRLHAELDARLDEEIATIRKHYAYKAYRIEDLPISDAGYVGSEMVSNLIDPGADHPDNGKAAMGDDGDSDHDRYPGESGTGVYLAEHERGAVDASAGVSDGGVGDGTEHRDVSKPYGISLEEFVDSPEGYQQITITYYASDKVLVDDKNGPIPDILGTVGPINPLAFGGLSEDPHIRYVRNDRLEADFEIILNAGSFADEILNYGRPDISQTGD